MSRARCAHQGGGERETLAAMLATKHGRETRASGRYQQVRYMWIAFFAHENVF